MEMSDRLLKHRWLQAASWYLGMIVQSHYRELFIAVWFLIYRSCYDLIYLLNFKLRIPRPKPPRIHILVKTKFPVAYQSPDHRIPWGTKYDNSTNKAFLLVMEQVIGRSTPLKRKKFLDLGCSGGQLVSDFRNLGWVAVGLEGSDYSFRHRRANWPSLAGKNLFTCDITKPFIIHVNYTHARFQLITAWEVLEHIKRYDLPMLFDNIVNHLDNGGYFIATTTSVPDVHYGVDLHQTKMSNHQWRKWIAQHSRELIPVNLGLKYYQFVRYNFEGSRLVYQKRPS